MGATQSTIDNTTPPPTYNEVFDDCPTTGWTKLEVGLIVGVTAALCLTLILVLCAPILGSIWKTGQYNETFCHYCNSRQDDDDDDDDDTNTGKLLMQATSKIVRGASARQTAATPSPNNV
jgi:hypothetical protein